MLHRRRLRQRGGAVRVLPSVLSLRRVELGALTVRTLLDRLAERLREMPEPPRVLMYGESLGARVAQEALQISPSLVSAEGRVDGLDALVSVGTRVAGRCVTRCCGHRVSSTWIAGSS